MAQSQRTVGKIAVLFGGNMLLSFLIAAIMPASGAIAEHFSGNAHAALYAEIVLVAPNAALLVGAPLAGWLIPRIGSRRMLLTALVIYTIGGSAGMILESFSSLALARGLAGLVAGAISTICFTLTGDYFQGAARTRALGWVGAAPDVGSIIALLAGGLLVDYGGWHAVFGLYLAGIPVLILACFVIEEPAQRVAAESESAALPSGIFLVYLVAVGVALVAIIPGVQLPFLLAEDGVRSATVAALLITATPLAATAVVASYPAMRRRLSINQISVMMMAAAAIVYLLLAFETGLPMIALALAICGIPAGLMIPHMAAIAMERASDAARSRAVGLIIGAVFLGQFSIPFVSEPIRMALGSHRMFGVLGGVLGGVVVVAAIGSRFVRVPAGGMTHRPSET